MAKPLGRIMHYNEETLIKVARIIKPEGELTDEDLEKAKRYFSGFDEGKVKESFEK